MICTFYLNFILKYCDYYLKSLILESTSLKDSIWLVNRYLDFVFIWIWIWMAISFLLCLLDVWCHHYWVYLLSYCQTKLLDFNGGTGSLLGEQYKGRSLVNFNWNSDKISWSRSFCKQLHKQSVYIMEYKVLME